MAFTHIFVLVIFAFAVDALKWRNCDKSSPVEFSAIHLSPHPLRLRAGEKVTFGGKVAVSGALGTQYTINVTPYKSAGWFGWIPLPCPEQCTLDIGCDQLVGLLEAVQCPLKQGVYAIEKQTLALPDLPIPSFLKSGKYKIRGDVRDRGSNKRVSCLEVEVEIRS
ncbi:hypothetical protein ACROYT_G001100 [Oculina patagonica]